VRLSEVKISLKTKLLVAVAVQVILIVAYRLGLDWLFYVNLLWGMLTIAYAFSIRCPACHKRQVFRGWSIFDLRLPGAVCFSCGTQLCSSRLSGRNA
jgi:thiamine transporter ThiT